MPGHISDDGYNSGPSYTRDGWTWFPDKVNHTISVDRYVGPTPHWRVAITSHAGSKPAEIVCVVRQEPGNDLMLQLLQAARFLEKVPDAEAVVQQ